MKVKVKKVSLILVMLMVFTSICFAYRFATDIWVTSDGGMNIGNSVNQVGSPLMSKTGYGNQTFRVNDSILSQSMQEHRINARLRWRTGNGAEGNCTYFIGANVGTTLTTGSNWSLDINSGSYHNPTQNSITGYAQDYYIQLYSDYAGGDIIWARWNLN
ncbi:MAG: hypothetical protein RSB51_04885 [Clostridia bacterium]